MIKLPFRSPLAGQPRNMANCSPTNPRIYWGSNKSITEIIPDFSDVWILNGKSFPKYCGTSRLHRKKQCRDNRGKSFLAVTGRNTLRRRNLFPMKATLPLVFWISVLKNGMRASRADSFQISVGGSQGCHGFGCSEDGGRGKNSVRILRSSLRS